MSGPDPEATSVLADPGNGAFLDGFATADVALDHVATATARAALHTATAEQLAAGGHWEDAYGHLHAAVRLLHALADPADELDRLRREHAEAREQSRRDSLTATYNRRYLDERLAAYLEEAIDPARTAADSAGISLALVDVDHFKKVNDTHGHLLGDRVLQRLVATLAAGLPEGSFCARYGGEEFAVVLPGVDPAAAVELCEELRDRIAHQPWHELAEALRVTVSIGVAHRAGQPTDVDPLVGEADNLLYAAKQSGRNAVAHRCERDGRVRLAGPAAARRSVPQPMRYTG